MRSVFRLQAVETADYDQPKAPLSRPCLVRAPSVPASFCFRANTHSFSFVFSSRLHICLPSFLHRRHPHPRCRIEQRLLDICNPGLIKKPISCISTQAAESAAARSHGNNCIYFSTYTTSGPKISTSPPSLRHSCCCIRTSPLCGPSHSLQLQTTDASLRLFWPHSRNQPIPRSLANVTALR